MTDKTITAKSTGGLYITKSTLFKIYLLLGVTLVSAVFIWYTFGVIDKLQQDTRDQVEKYVKLWQLAANSPTTGGIELQFIFEEIIVKAAFPIIVLDENYKPIHWRNIPGIEPEDTTAATRARLKEISDKMRQENDQFELRFAEDHINYFCYGDSKAIEQLKMMPFIEIGIVVAFMIVALIGFHNIKRSEERHIWVGMAKETAHQLGTPISSLMGWLELIEGDKESGGEPVSGGELQDAVDNMKVDVRRLQRIANRFGMIGSIPELRPYDLNNLITETVEYFRRRLPFEGQGIKINFEPGNIPKVSLNAELLGWTLENLIKNALQAVDSKTGRLEIRTLMDETQKNVNIEIQDNGLGIPAGAARKVFRPGFTTKKRGWGLGLTLVKRIVEEYHGGVVCLKKSKPGETIFELNLPVR